MIKSLYFFFVAMFLISCKSTSTIDFAKLEASQPEMPLLTQKESVLLKAKVTSTKPIPLEAFTLYLKSDLKNFDLSEISVYIGDTDKQKDAVLFASSQKITSKIDLKGNYIQKKAPFFVWILAKTASNPNLLNKIKFLAWKFTQKSEKLALHKFLVMHSVSEFLSEVKNKMVLNAIVYLGWRPPTKERSSLYTTIVTTIAKICRKM